MADAVVGCDEGILLFFAMHAVKESLAIVKGVELGSTTELIHERIKCDYSMKLPSNHPVTHIHDLEKVSQTGKLLIGQVDGNITIINYMTQTRILSLQLSGMSSDADLLTSKPQSLNVLYFVRPYADFNIEHNPVLLVSE